MGDLLKASPEDATPRGEELETPQNEIEGENPLEEKSEEAEKPDKKSDTQPSNSEISEIKRRDAQISHWRKKAEVAEEKLKSQKPDVPVEGQDEWKSKVELLVKNPDKRYTDKEVDHITNVATRKGVSLEEAAKSEEDYIQFEREKVAKEKGTPSPSSPSSTIGGKSSEEIQKMSNKEYSAHLKEGIKKQAGNRGI